MCKNNSCPSRMKCYRYLCVASHVQSYGNFSVPNSKNKCDYYMEVKSGSCTLQEVLIEDAIYNYNRLRK